MSEINKPYLIGITGGSGSGKTSFISELKAFFSKDQLCILSQDNYYISREDQPIDSQGVKNFDTPNSINQEEFARDVSLLKKGQIVRRKEYTYNNPNVVAKDLEFKPAPVIVIEGIFVFYLQQVASLLDLKIFIDAEDFLNLKRRIIRDGKERGYDMDDVLYRFEKHVMPTFRKYIVPFRNDADLIIPNNENFDKGLEVLVGFIRQKIGQPE
ncbi:uridine kinase [Reichenbachiella sp. MALMAid0571]|uniref:uridine kinase family protein n=1 Tax=Reichenbachiella sp. MALMAid0571 TaxID=3143939 RepID=UPI0032DE729E